MSLAVAPLVFETPLRVLVVDEHTLFRSGLVLLLRQRLRPLELVEAADLGEAKLGLVSLGRVDIVLLDLALEGDAHDGQASEDALDVLRRCRGLTPGAAVIALADRAVPAAMTRLLAAGVDGFIDKTARADAVIGVVTQVLGSHSPALHPALAGGVPGAKAGLRSLNAGLAIQVPHVMPRPPHAPASPAPQRERASRTALEDMEALGLSARQIDVMTLLADGLSNKAISRELGVAESTVKTHVIGLYQKLGVASRTEAVLAISQRGWRSAPGAR